MGLKVSAIDKVILGDDVKLFRCAAIVGDLLDTCYDINLLAIPQAPVPVFSSGPSEWEQELIGSASFVLLDDMSLEVSMAIRYDCPIRLDIENRGCTVWANFCFLPTFHFPLNHKDFSPVVRPQLLDFSHPSIVLSLRKFTEHWSGGVKWSK